MPKDLLTALQQAHGDVERDYPIEADTSQSDDQSKGIFMEHFFHEVEALRASIDKVESLVEQVKTIHSDILSSPNQDEETKRRLEEVMADIKRLANAIRLKLKSMEKNLVVDETQCNSADYRIRKTQYMTITRTFIDIMTAYNAAQVSHREACKKRIQRQMELADKEISDDQLEEMLETGNVAIFTREIMAETQQAQRSLRDIEARHEDIVKLEQSIRELHDMFVDMALLVEAQGEMVDRIEYNVDQTVDHVRKAKEQTTQAVKYQSSARRKLIILIIVVSVILIIIIASVLGGVLPKH